MLSVDYRRSPEHRFPAPYDDGMAAIRFLDDPKNHPADVPLDVSRCFLAGDSAGGNIAHHVAQRWTAAMPTTASSLRLAGAVLIQPFFGGEERTEAEVALDRVGLAIPNQRATAVPIKKTVVATGRRKGFWNLLTFSRKGTVNKPVGTETIKRTPNNLLGTVRSI